MQASKELVDRLLARQCLACGADSPKARLCDGCQPKPPVGAFSAQVRSSPGEAIPSFDHAWLVDCFGRVHHFSVEPGAQGRFVIGRDAKCCLSIADRSISREHAALERRPGADRWTVEDLGSRNGTTASERPAQAPLPLRSGDALSVAAFGFRFFEVAGPTPLEVLATMGNNQAEGPTTVSQFWQQTIAFAPTDGAGGFVTVEHEGPSGLERVRVPLSDLDFTLLYLLAGRYQQTGNFEPVARGWVSSAELLDGRVPFGTDTPTSNNLRGAIKRIRDKFRNHGIEGVVESRQNIGYRLGSVFHQVRL